MTAAQDIENFDAVQSDPADPVQTPRGVNVADETLAAAQTLTDAGIALDAPLGEIQYAERNGQKIPTPGGEGWVGMFSMIVTKLEPDPNLRRLRLTR